MSYKESIVKDEIRQKTVLLVKLKQESVSKWLDVRQQCTTLRYMLILNSITNLCNKDTRTTDENQHQEDLKNLEKESDQVWGI